MVFCTTARQQVVLLVVQPILRQPLPCETFNHRFNDIAGGTCYDWIRRSFPFSGQKKRISKRRWEEIVIGTINVTTKQFMADNGVFADAFNFLLYGGAPVIRPECLRELDTGQTAFVRRQDRKGEAVEKSRDLLKGLVAKEDGEKTYLILGIENQTDVHYAMPVRNMMYNAMSYEKQVKQKAKERRTKGQRETLIGAEYLSGMGKDDRLQPVITLVVYFGSRAWDGPTSLYEMLDIKDERILPWVNDYKVHLLAPEGLQEEDFGKFRTELGPVMKYIRCSGDKEKLRELTAGEERYRSLSREAAEVLNSCAGFRLKINEGEEKVDMRNAWDEHFDDGVAKGRREGRIAMFQEIMDMMSRDMTREQIARQLHMELPVSKAK